MNFTIHNAIRNFRILIVPFNDHMSEGAFIKVRI